MKLLILSVFWITVLTQQLSPPKFAKDPIVQDRKTTDESRKSKTGVQSKSSDRTTVGHPEGKPSSDAEENTDQTQPEKRAYKIEVISQPRQPSDPWFIASVILTGALTFVAFGTLIVIWRQTNKIGQQVTQMVEAGKQTERLVEQATATAKAALLNAQAVINAERAWIFCHWEGSCLYMENHGRTPAEIIDVVQKDAVADLLPIQDAVTLPDIPNYGPKTILTHKRVLATGEKWVPPEWCTHLTDVLPPDVYEQVTKTRKRFFFYGVVRYRDVLPNSDIHETRFCYFWSPTIDRFIIGGPPEYTKHT